MEGPVLIIGAGIVGLTLGHGLRKASFPHPAHCTVSRLLTLLGRPAYRSRFTSATST